MPLELEYEANGLASNEDELRSLICRHQPRWKTLSLWVHRFPFFDIFTGPPASGWASLSHLTLWSFNFIAIRDPSRLYDAVEKMTSLRRIVVNDHSAYKYTRRHGPIGLSELDILLYGALTDHQANLISSYPNLTTLTLILTSYTILELSDESHVILPSLLAFVLETPDLALLGHLTTPALHRLEIYNRSDKKYLTEPHNDAFSRFIDRCTSKLSSITLGGSMYELFIPWALPQLSNRPSITHLTLNLWPSSFTAILWKRVGKEAWFPNLRHLTVSLEAEKSIELGRMEALAAWLKQRQDMGTKGLECLTLHNRSQNLAFPYDLFKDVRLGRLCVMIRLGSK
jgi:hypothetical protein